MKYALALLSLTFTLNAAAGCPLEAPNKMPVTPDGASASPDTMASSMSAVRAYVRTIEDLLECRGIMLSSSHYDELLSKAMDAANAFNTQLRIYQENNETLAQN
jgi:hypothetical protein|tara:strand:+ start:10091 stop:10402 length:312 start_codon:yes stop_codon:yes gene_type:complete